MLWLALLVPLAQFAANWHTQSHWGEERSSLAGGKHALAGEQCDLCLTAAAVTGGSATSSAASALPGAARHATPPMRPGAALPQRVSLGYESRAPPASLR